MLRFDLNSGTTLPSGISFGLPGQALALRAGADLHLADLWQAEVLVPSKGRNRGPVRFEKIDYLELIPRRISTELIESRGSSIVRNSPCDKCGQFNLEVTGVEDVRTRFNQQLGTRVVEHVNREGGLGIRLRSSDLPAPIFGIEEAPHIVLVNDTAKTWFEAARVTNIQFLNYGDVIP